MEQSRSILYIEDNPDNRLLVRRILLASGFQLAEAPDGHSGIKLAEEIKPDLILMDINLPEVDGYSLTARLKANPALARIPVIALTANVMKGDREKSIAAGCDGYIQKPVDVDALPRDLDRFIAQARR